MCKNVLEVVYHHAKFGGARISPAAGAAKKESFYLFVCLSLCLSVTLLNVRVCAPDFAMKALEYRNDSDTDDRGRFVATALNTEVENMAKLRFFAARGRKITPIETKFGVCLL